MYLWLEATYLHRQDERSDHTVPKFQLTLSRGYFPGHLDKLGKSFQPIIQGTQFEGNQKERKMESV
jgi:hypothetical protein